MGVRHSQQILPAFAAVAKISHHLCGLIGEDALQAALSEGFDGHSRAPSDLSAYSPVFIGISWMHTPSVDGILRAWIWLLFLIWIAWIATRCSRSIVLSNRS